MLKLDRSFSLSGWQSTRPASSCLYPEAQSTILQWGVGPSICWLSPNHSVDLSSPSGLAPHRFPESHLPTRQARLTGDPPLPFRTKHGSNLPPRFYAFPRRRWRQHDPPTSAASRRYSQASERQGVVDQIASMASWIIVTPEF